MDFTKCWSCGVDRAPASALCPSCGKVQPPRPAGTLIDKFAVLGLAPAVDLELAHVEEQYRALSRKLHPDKFVRATPQERRFSLEQTTILNDAFRTLKDPVRRAEHVLQLRGAKIAFEGSKLELPPEFLEQAMDDREQLLEAKASGESGAVEKLAEGMRGKRDAALAEVRTLLSSSSAPDDARAAELLAKMKYYSRYLDEVEGRAPEV